MAKSIIISMFLLIIFSGCSNIEEELRTEIYKEKQINAELNSTINSLKQTLSIKIDQIDSLKQTLRKAEDDYSELLEKCDIFDTRNEKKGDGGIFNKVFD